MNSGHLPYRMIWLGAMRSIIAENPCSNTVRDSFVRIAPTVETVTVPPEGKPSKQNSKVSGSAQDTVGMTFKFDRCII